MEGKIFDLAVIGSGVMGLGCVLQAAQDGKRVVVIDPANDEAKASWAAAGILVTRGARNFLSPFREFYVRSIQLYPDWLQEVSKFSGQEVVLHQGGDYQIYNIGSPKGMEQYQSKVKQLDREHSQGFSVSDQMPGFLSEFSPLENLKAFHFPNEAYVQNRDLLLALRAACLKVGVHFIAEAPVGAWEYGAGTTKLSFTSDRLEARQILVAAGAWSSKVLTDLGFSAPMIPVKGQMCRIRKFYPEACMVHFNEDIYLVPRGDSLIVGATTEPGVWREGFDQTGEKYIHTHLDEFLPEIAKEPVESWAGFRPRTKDRLPWMGWIDEDKSWAICTGHYKCGVSMAPLAARCMASLLKGEKPVVDLAPFDPWRRHGLSRLPSG